jgi:sodium-dependent phosphate transporter
MVLHQFDYIFAIAMLFAFLDAWNIGANDVANSFASSVSSRSLKYWQAMVLAGLCEFLGAVLVGSRVSDTIRSKILDFKVFEDDPATLMLTMTCALVGSSVWLTIATLIGMPVSTTHSIVGGVIGSAIAARGAKNIHWGWDGVSQIIALWFIAPIIAGLFASIIFLISKYGVLEVKDINTSIRNALVLVPIMVFAAFSILTMLIVWKGSPSLKLDDLSGRTIAGAVLGVGAVALVLYMLFCFPVFKRKIVDNDWTLKWYSIFIGPIYWFKSTDDIPPMPEGHQLTIDYYKGRRQVEEAINEQVSVSSEIKEEHINAETRSVSDISAKLGAQKQTTKQLWWSLLKQGPKKWGYLAWLVVSHGFTKDVILDQVNSGDMLSGDLKAMHAKSKYYDNRVEYLYSLLQAITAATMSFAHGANDIANATGPLSTIYLVWRTNTTAAKADVPVWVLCYAAGALVIGCWTYGYRIMTSLGNKLILQSPSRGFLIELGAAVTTVMATQLAIPVSTTQSAVGATVFIGLCNRDLRAVNWRMVIWCYLGWFITLPVAGIIAGLLNAIILHAPRDGANYQMN